MLRSMSFSEDVKINPTKLVSYFSFMRGAKSANSKLFKDFCNEAEMEKNKQIVGFILTSSLKKWINPFLLVLSTLLLLSFSSCHSNNNTPDISNIKVSLQTYRFDKDLYA